VVCDRYIGSSVAYQGHGRELGAEEVAALSTFAVDGLVPDLVVLLEVDAAEATARLAAGDAPDRMESAGEAFHQRVADGYRAQAAADRDRWVTVDGTGNVDEVAARVNAVVAERLGDAMAQP
jgi:dTMP kinase